jgi:type VI secretion system protein ImpL
MTIKGLLFCLFLYVGLVWVGAAYWNTGDDIRRIGLLGTGIGFLAVLVLVIGARLLAWWRLSRAKSAARPAATAAAKPAATVHPDDEALTALIAEANAALAKLPAYTGRSTPLASLPLYLLIGPEGSGKTSTFLNSGLEPLLLAGQVSGTNAVVPTRLCNLWLAQGAVFAEFGGRIFSGEAGRWTQLVRVLRGRTTIPRWRRFWGEQEPQRDFRGVIAFCDSKELTSASSDPQRLERSSREWQDRLRPLAEVFGMEFPVYLLVTKCDQIPFFSDFFRRLPELDTRQVLGCTLPLRDNKPAAGEVFAEAEAKRLTDSFRPLYRALAERRLTQLAHEPSPAQRPGVYEFPRELKRIRSPLVQFLTDVFRPPAFEAGPLLRGYYLTGVREGETAAGDPGATRVNSNPLLSLEATRLFRADSLTLQIDDPTRSPAGGRRSGSRWLFVADFFEKVLLADRPHRTIRVVEDRFQGRRRAALAGLCGVCAILCIAFLLSWVNNRDLLRHVEAAAGVAGNIARLKPALLSELKALDDMRAQIVGMRKGLGVSYHWGLYSGDRILDAARLNYFRRFHQLLLGDLNGAMVSELMGLPADPGENSPYDPAFRTLKAHLLITSETCAPDAELLSSVLKDYRPRIAPDSTSEWRALADAQIDFYASELQHGSALRLPQDKAAADKARLYLRKIKGVERLYRSILANAEKSLPKTQRVSELVPDYTKVLKGPDGVSPAFSRDGWNFVEKASKKGVAASEGEACVVGEPSGVAGEFRQTAETSKAIQRMFLRDYIENWRKFLEGYSVVRYTSAADAAQKLETLSGHRSPLLAVLYLAANQTYFTPPVSEPGGALKKIPVVGDALAASVKKAEDKGKASVRRFTEASDGLNGPEDITLAFQPVDLVEPPGSEAWIVEKSNGAYIEALAQLRRSMNAIADSDRDPAVHQAAAQAYDKALDSVRQMSAPFHSTGVGGLDTTVLRLLEEPIRLANGFIIKDMEKAGAAKINSDLRTFCSGVAPMLRKYPFRTASQDDVLPEELTRAFGPGQGFWKFAQQSLAELVVKEGSRWKAKDPAKKPQVTTEMLAFLNRAQEILDAFYAAGTPQPQLAFTLRPTLDRSFQDSVLELEVDGQNRPWTGSLQKPFSWPAASGTKDAGAEARVRTSGNVVFVVASRPGVWGIFRIFSDAEDRQFGAKRVEWKYSSGGVGRRGLIKPAPVTLEIVSFPGDVDVFNPRFWVDLQCPKAAVQ